MLSSIPIASAEARSILPPDLGDAIVAPAAQAAAVAIDWPMTDRFLNMLFGYVEEGAIMFRGIGEAGTSQEGVFRENVAVSLASASEETVKGLQATVRRWGQHHVATFIVPATLDPICLDEQRPKGTEDRVKLFTTLCLDIDTGDTGAKLAHLRAHFFAPTMIVESGGITAEGHPKLHLWWKLTEPTADLQLVAKLRAMIASKVGGDPSFGRIAQVIRVPGTIYAKNGIAKLCRIVDGSHDLRRRYDLTELAQRVDEMQSFPGLPVPASPQRPTATAARTEDGSFDFSGAAGMQTQAERTEGVLIKRVHKGGVDGITRHDSRNLAIGHFIRRMRDGLISREQLNEEVRGWEVACVEEPLNDVQLLKEVKALIAVDEKNHGPMPARSAIAQAAPQIEDVDFEAWKVGNCFSGPVPTRVFLVRGLIQAGRSHAVAAEAGAGKTETVYDVALKLAAASVEGPQLTWWGQPIGPAAYDGTVIFITTEDGRDELHIRLKKADPSGELARRAADRLIVLPLVDLGGARPLLRKNPRTGEVEAMEW